MTVDLIHADCLDAMREMPEASIDAVVTDPPYGWSFMGRGWDHGVPGVEFWREALRVTKPGGHIVAFGGPRTFHRLTCAIEDAGWEVRDCLSWLYGSGFPKSLDVSKSLDKAAGAERDVLGTHTGSGMTRANAVQGAQQRLTTEWPIYSATPVTDAARQWNGWGTALKPAWEPIILARKPLVGTVASNVLAHGTGAINVDGCRIGTESTRGRWPANVALDEEAAVMLGEPSRFFYVAKASRRERGAGNTHPTVKPQALMRMLVRLVTPPGGTILDPFAGSGTTGIAAHLEGFDATLVEKQAEYIAIIEGRFSTLTTNPDSDEDK